MTLNRVCRYLCTPQTALVVLCALAPLLALPWISPATLDVVPFVPALLIALLGFGAAWRLRGGDRAAVSLRAIMPVFIVAGIALISLAFSLSPHTSLAGFNLETGTFLSILFATLFFVAGWVYLRAAPYVRLAVSLLEAGAMLTTLATLWFVGSRFFLANELTALPGAFDISFAAGLAAVLSLSASVHRARASGYRLLFGAFALLAMVTCFLLPTVTSVWAGIAAASLFIAVEQVVLWKKTVSLNSGERRFPIIPFVVGVIALGAIFMDSMALPRPIVPQTLPAVPPLSSSVASIAGFFMDHPARLLFGAGPGQFLPVWNHRATGTVSHAAGLYDAALADLGIIGLLSVLAVFFVVIGRGVRRSISVEITQRSEHGALVAVLYGAVAFISYYPTVTQLYVFCLLLGTVYGSERPLATQSRYLSDARSVRMRTIAHAVLLVGSVLVLALSFLGFISVESYESGVAYALGPFPNLIKSQASIAGAVRLYPQPVYYRALAEIQGQLLSQTLTDSNLSPDERRNGVAMYAKGGIDNARMAVALEPSNYLNFVVLGDLYTTLASLGISGALEQGKAAYAQALELAPYNTLVHGLANRLVGAGE